MFVLCFSQVNTFNLVFIELKRKNPEVYYFRGEKECDFLIKEKTKIIQLIQSTYITDKEDLKEKRIKSLIKASNELRCNNLLIITWDYEDESKIDRKKIKFIPLWKWLLQN